jgi:GAF domain-containing protein
VEDTLGSGLSSRQEAQRIQVLYDLHLLGEPASPVLSDLCCRAQNRFGVAAALVTLIDREQQVISASVGTDLDETLRTYAFCDHLLGSDEVLVVPDAWEDPRFATNPLVTGEPFIRFYAGAPLVFSQDVRLGGFCLLDTSSRVLSPEEEAELIDLADEAIACTLEQVFRRVASDA